MVVKRTCTFCAGEIEPGTGTMFIKRDGAVFHFCSSSCRKQQLHLGRVGHRLKWTRAHALRRQTEQSSAAGKAAAAAAAAAAASAKAAAKSAEKPKVPEPAVAKTEAPESAAEAAAPSAEGAVAPAKKPRAKKPKPAAPTE
jgi:large subunit ribosomal protein L24e